MWVCGCVAGLHFCSYVHVCGHIWACTACWGHPVHKQVTLWTLIIYKWSTFISHWVNNSEGGREGELCTCMPLFPEATSKRKILDWSQTVFANYCNHCLISASIQFILYCQARCQHTNLPLFCSKDSPNAFWTNETDIDHLTWLWKQQIRICASWRGFYTLFCSPHTQWRKHELFVLCADYTPAIPCWKPGYCSKESSH